MSLLMDLTRELIKLDEPTLLMIDKQIAAALGWGDGKTVSYHLGKLEEGLTPFMVTPTAAAKVCAILAGVLGPNHCQNAIKNEGG
jgi:hypothetical protein